MRYIIFIDITHRREHGHFVVSGWVEAPDEDSAAFAALDKRGKSARVRVMPWDEGTEEMRQRAIEKGQLQC